MAGDLTVSALGYRYPRSRHRALDEVSTVFPSGTCSAVLGATGAGKSTLLKALTGIVPELSGGSIDGQVRYGRADLADHRVATITQYIGLVQQDPAGQVIGRTVFEDVAFGPRNHLVPRAEVTHRVRSALGQVGLAGFAERATTELSGGELQRLAVAAALAMSPEMLCLDEATAELDPSGAAELRSVLAGLQSSGLGTVLAEHDPQDVLANAGHLVVLDEGRVAWQGVPADFFSDPGRVAALGIRPAPMSVLAGALLRLRPGLAATLPASRLPLDAGQASDWLAPLLAGRRPSCDARRASAATGPAAIEVAGLRFGYRGGPEVLHGTDLHVAAGEFVALAGPNGAGKSTLLKHLNGLLRPTHGRVRVAGLDVSSHQTWQLAPHVGFVFQNPDHQIFRRTVRDEVGYGPATAGLLRAEVDRRVAGVLEQTGLAALAGRHPLTLGRSERQLVAMASTLVSQPAVLVIDEPTTGLDQRAADTVMALVDRLNARGTTIVMTSHDPEVVARHAHRVITIDHGRVVADGPVAGHADTELSRLWRRLFGDDSVPLLDEEAAARALADLLEVPR